jgi:hypothetical protein
VTRFGDAEFQARVPLTEAYRLSVVSLLHGRGQYLTRYVNMSATFNM